MYGVLLFCMAPFLTAQSATNLTALLCRTPGRMVVVGTLGPIVTWPVRILNSFHALRSALLTDACQPAKSYFMSPSTLTVFLLFWLVNIA